ncbi:MAG: N-6 DNA methylase [Gammaproteobacteria bacterium]|nr:N-6 DNA methylase [Gammaproteobacteria bacterium]
MTDQEFHELEELELHQADLNKSRQLLKEDRRNRSLLRSCIYELGSPSYIQKMGLFVTLVCLYNEQLELFIKLKELASNEERLAIHHLLIDFEIEKGWQADKSDDSLQKIDLFNDVLTYLSPLRRLSDAIQFIYTQKLKGRIYSTLVAIISADHKLFEFQMFDFDTEELIIDLMEAYGFKPDLTFRDSAAGCGISANRLTAGGATNKGRVILEEQNPDLCLLAKKLAYLDNPHNRPACFTHNALLGDYPNSVEQADFYVTFPKIPHPLNHVERNARPSFLVIPHTGELSRNASDALWVQHALSAIKEGGMAFITVQDGFLRRPGYDHSLRQYLIENRLVEAVITLNESHAKTSQYNSVSLIILNKEPKQLEETVRFFDIRHVNPHNFANALEDSSLSKVYLMDGFSYECFVEIGEILDIRFDVSYKDLIKNNYSLLLQDYKKDENRGEVISVTEETEAYQLSLKQLESASEIFEKICVAASKK